MRRHLPSVFLFTMAAATLAGQAGVRALPWNQELTPDAFTPMDVCHELMTEDGTPGSNPVATCRTRTDWQLHKEVFPTSLAKPNRSGVTYTVSVVEGDTHLELGVQSLLSLTGKDLEGTSVRGIVVNLQMEMGTEHQFVTVASGTVGKVNPFCGCGYVGNGENLAVQVYDENQQPVTPTGDGIIDIMALGEERFVVLDTKYDVTTGTVPQGSKTRLQACVQYVSALANEESKDLCTVQGGELRVTKGCTAFPFDKVAIPALEPIKLVETMSAPKPDWVSGSGFKAAVNPADASGGATILPDGTPLSIALGKTVLNYDVTPSGLGSVRTLTIQGNLTCGENVSCTQVVDGMCISKLQNDVELTHADGTPIASATASVDIGCPAYQCNGGDDKRCNDQNPCTDDTCDPGRGCVNAPIADSAVCDDGNACTHNEQCLGGVCTAGDKIVCPSDGNPCTTDACDPLNGQCRYDALPNRTKCDDQNVCTTDDECFGGKCLGGDPIACADDGNPCKVHACDPVVGCSGPATNRPNRTPCDDKNPCTVDDICTNGGCVSGAPASCDDGNPCTTDTCIPGGGCRHDMVANRTPCDDHNACTVDDSCIEGTCKAGSARSCDDQNPCTAESCDTTNGCQYLPLNGSCDDKNACTTSSLCLAGHCSPGPGSQLDCDDANPCTNDRCDLVNGCVHDNVAANTACDDGDPCSDGDRCLAGTCMAMHTTVCDDGNACTSSTCLPGQGCVNIPRVGGLCDDGNPCTGPDLCQVDTLKPQTPPSCKAGATLSCDDQNPCTQDSCSAIDGCRHTPLTGVACEDGDACTPIGTCSVGVCQTPTRMDCDDGNPCTFDQCDTLQGCQNIPTTGSCDDGDVCTGPDYCDGLGRCTAGQAITCDDGDVCTRDVCRPDLGCVFLHRSETPCNDNNPCTLTDVCVDGVCTGRDPVTCDDNNPCTTDSCDAAGCHHAPRTGACEDGNRCTIGDQCYSGVCKAGPTKECRDTDSCTNDACDAATGLCVFSYRENGASCDDGDACTGCPWPEAVVRIGYRAADAIPDPTYCAAGVRPVALELSGLDGPGTKTTMSARTDFRFVILSESEAALRGTLYVTSGGARNDVAEWKVDIALRYRGIGRAGQGATIFAEFPAGIQATPYTDLWKYWDIKSGSTMTRSAATGNETLTIGPDTSQQSLPLQVGLRANGRNLGYGAAVPVRWTRQAKYGQGLIRLNLTPVFCQRSDVCQGNTCSGGDVCQGNACSGGTVRTSCRDLEVGDYCTYDDRDFSGGCERTGGTSAACALAGAWPKIAVERTSCATQLGYAFGFNGYRRLSFTTLANLMTYLPSTSGGPGNPAQVELCNPAQTAGTPAASHAIALDLSIGLSDAGVMPAPGGVSLGDLIWNSGACVGLSIREIVRRAEMAASGVRPPDGACYDAPTLTATVSDIIQGFYRCQATTTKAVLPE